MNRRSFLALLAATTVPIPSFVLALPSDESEVIVPAVIETGTRYILSVQYASESMCIADLVSDGKVLASLASPANVMCERDMLVSMMGMPKFKAGSLSLRPRMPGKMVAVVESVVDNGGINTISGFLTMPNMDRKTEMLIGEMA